MYKPAFIDIYEAAEEWLKRAGEKLLRYRRELLVVQRDLASASTPVILDPKPGEATSVTKA